MKTKMFFVIVIMTAITAGIWQQANAQSWKIGGNHVGRDTTLGTLNNHALKFVTNNCPRVFIGSGGRVGIGTTSPAAKLDVLGGSDDLYTTEGDVRIGNSAYRLKIGVTTNGNNAGDVRIKAAGGTNRLILGTTGVNTPLLSNSDALTIDSAGRVGINNITPGATLDIRGEVNINSTNGCFGCYVFSSYSLTGNAIRGQSSYGTGVTGTSGKSSGVSGSSSTSSGVVGSSGNSYGVYATSQNADGLYATTGNSSHYAGNFAGDVFTTGTYLSSDQKLKQNIREISSAMNIINQLQPRQYEFRKDGNYKLMNLPQGNHFGLIAQDVEKVLPNLIKDSKFEVRSANQNTAEGENAVSETIQFKALNYTELISIIIKGMQEQQAVIEKQQVQIQDLKQMVDKWSGTSNAIAGADKEQSIRTDMEINRARLQQSIPNPFKQNTIIPYYLPQASGNAAITITDENGKTIKTIPLSAKGNGQVLVQAGDLASGTYQYSLMVDNQLIDTKKMIVIK